MKFSAVLFDEGDKVQITDGQFKGTTGIVVAWAHVSSRVEDVVHIIRLDKPVVATVSKKTEVGGGKTMVEEEEVTFEQAEIPASGLSAV